MEAGGTTIDRTTSQDLKWAELWIGTHANGPASLKLPNGTSVPLKDILGGDLPFFAQGPVGEHGAVHSVASLQGPGREASPRASRRVQGPEPQARNGDRAEPLRGSVWVPRRVRA